MATDRTITWSVWTPAAGVPSLRALRLICEDYTAGLGAAVAFSRDRLYLTLPGTVSHPLRRVAMPPPYEEHGRERWIEVWKGVSEGRWVVDVMTRSSDEVTGAVADRLAAIVHRWWGGEREAP